MSASTGAVPMLDSIDLTVASDASTGQPANVVAVTSEANSAPGSSRTKDVLRFGVALLGAFAVFAVLMWLRGVNPLQAYRDMFVSTFTDRQQLAGIGVRAIPIVLAALAVSVPARAGLINVGGEGQLLMGGVAAMGVSLLFDGQVIGPVTLVAMGLSAAVVGGLWAALAGVLRLTVGIAESVSTLLLNYLALDLLYFLIYERWKDRQGSGQPATRAVLDAERLPLIAGTRLHAGAVVAIMSVLIIFLVFRLTSWGFRLRAVGGNSEAARRAGLPVNRLLVSSMLVGGALAGLGGFAQLAGAEYKLRPGYGYVAFLASWLGRHRPFPVLLSCLVVSAIAISGDSLQLDSQLPASSVNVLTALLLIGIFGFGRKKGSVSR
jgi:general nucleoside transport system permease protein